MSTGSLCAERNVIGSALAADITLTRADMRFLAVYSATLPKRPNLTARRDSGDASSSWGEGGFPDPGKALTAPGSP